jgi:hypothetical protein
VTDGIDPEQALLSSIRQELSPTSADRERVTSRVAARIATGVLTPSLPEHLDAPKPVGAWPGLRGLGQQVVAAGLLSVVTFGAGYLLGRQAPPSAALVTVPPAAAVPPAALQPPPPPALAPQAMPSVEPPGPPSASSYRRQEPAAPASANSGQTLSEEARELRRVDSALRGGMPLLALGILRDLDQKIPRGALTEERAAARLIARCQNGEAGARSGAVTWLEKNARSVYATRVQASCTEPPP